MTGSPFSLVLATKTDSGAAAPSFSDVIATQVSDTTSETQTRPDDSPGETSVAVEVDRQHGTHESGEDETQGQTDTSGNYTAGS